MKRKARFLATREGYCLALVKIRRTGNHSQIAIRELWWLPGLFFCWQQVLAASGEPLLRLILKGYGWLDLTLAMGELTTAVWNYGMVWIRVQLDVTGIVVRSLWWALSPRLL